MSRSARPTTMMAPKTSTPVAAAPSVEADQSIAAQPKARPSARPKSTFGGGGDYCHICDKSVYPMDKITADAKIFHKVHSRVEQKKVPDCVCVNLDVLPVRDVSEGAQAG